MSAPSIFLKVAYLEKAENPYSKVYGDLDRGLVSLSQDEQGKWTRKTVVQPCDPDFPSKLLKDLDAIYRYFVWETAFEVAGSINPPAKVLYSDFDRKHAEARLEIVMGETNFIGQFPLWARAGGEEGRKKFLRTVQQYTSRIQHVIKYAKQKREELEEQNSRHAQELLMTGRSSLKPELNDFPWLQFTGKNAPGMPGSDQLAGSDKSVARQVLPKGGLNLVRQWERDIDTVYRDLDQAEPQAAPHKQGRAFGSGPSDEGVKDGLRHKMIRCQVTPGPFLRNSDVENRSGREQFWRNAELECGVTPADFDTRYGSSGAEPWAFEVITKKYEENAEPREEKVYDKALGIFK